MSWEASTRKQLLSDAARSCCCIRSIFVNAFRALVYFQIYVALYQCNHNSAEVVTGAGQNSCCERKRARQDAMHILVMAQNHWSRQNQRSDASILTQGAYSHKLCIECFGLCIQTIRVEMLPSRLFFTIT